MIEWNITTRRSAHTFTDAHTQTILQIHANEDMICTQGREGDLKCWDIETRKTLHGVHFITPYEVQQLSFCKFSILGSLAALPHSKNVVALHQVNKTSNQHVALIDPDNKMQQSATNRGMLMSVLLHRRNEIDYLLCGMENGQTLLYDIRNTAEPVRTYLPPKLQAEMKDSVFEEEEDLFAMSGDPVLVLALHGERFITGTTGNTLSVMSLNEEAVVKQYALSHPGISDIATAENHPDKIISRIMCTAGWDHRVRIFDMKRHKPLALYKYHTQTVNCVDIQKVVTDDQDGCLLASGSKDNRIALWPLIFKEKEKKTK
jgi:WD40 repeat protein